MLKAIHKSLPAHRLLLAGFFGLLITAALFTLAVRASGVPPQLIQYPILKLAIVAIAGPLALLGLIATVSILDNTEIKRKMCVITTGGGSSFIKAEEITTIRTRPGPRGSLAVRIVYERNGKRRVRTRWAPASLDRDRLDTMVEELLRRARDHA